MLSRKVEGIDPKKPWQPLFGEKVLHSIPFSEEDN